MHKGVDHEPVPEKEKQIVHKINMTENDLLTISGIEKNNSGSHNSKEDSPPNETPDDTLKKS